MLPQNSEDTSVVNRELVSASTGIHLRAPENGAQGGGKVLGVLVPLLLVCFLRPDNTL